MIALLFRSLTIHVFSHVLEKDHIVQITLRLHPVQHMIYIMCPLLVYFFMILV